MAFGALSGSDRVKSPADLGGDTGVLPPARLQSVPGGEPLPIHFLPISHVFMTKNLTRRKLPGRMAGMTHRTRTARPRDLGTAATVRKRIESGGERVWRYSDFEGLPVSAVSKVLSRLNRRGVIERLGKGMYYRSRMTAFGASRPNRAQIGALPMEGKRIFPAGIGAANLLGLTTQSPARPEVATTSTSLPRLIIGTETIVHGRRPEAWGRLSETDAALLDFLRNRGETSDLSAEQLVSKLLDWMRKPGQFQRLADVAASEPPRVRALLGAIGQEIGVRPAVLRKLREGLNPLSRFDFGLLRGLKFASAWQAKRGRQS